MRVALSLHFELAKLDQSWFHFLMFRSLDLQGDDAVIRVYGDAGNVIEAHEQEGEFKRTKISFLSRRAAASFVLNKNFRERGMLGDHRRREAATGGLANSINTGDRISRGMSISSRWSYGQKKDRSQP
jgi:hypothetical protein